MIIRQIKIRVSPIKATQLFTPTQKINQKIRETLCEKSVKNSISCGIYEYDGAETGCSLDRIPRNRRQQTFLFRGGGHTYIIPLSFLHLLLWKSQIYFLNLIFPPSKILGNATDKHYHKMYLLYHEKIVTYRLWGNYFKLYVLILGN